MAFKNRSRFDNRIRLNKKLGIMYAVVLVLVASLGVGYAAFSTTLEVNGDAIIKNSSWNIQLSGLTVKTGSVTPTTPATITGGNTVTFAANLAEPGDFYEFNVNVVNSGTMDAKLNGINISPALTSAEQAYLEYSVTYSDDTAIQPNDVLNHGATRTFKVSMKYKDGIDPSLYSLVDKNFNIAVTFDYVQQ